MPDGPRLIRDESDLLTEQIAPRSAEYHIGAGEIDRISLSPDERLNALYRYLLLLAGETPLETFLADIMSDTPNLFFDLPITELGDYLLVGMVSVFIYASPEGGIVIRLCNRAVTEEEELSHEYELFQRNVNIISQKGFLAWELSKVDFEASQEEDSSLGLVLRELVRSSFASIIEEAQARGFTSGSLSLDENGELICKPMMGWNTTLETDGVYYLEFSPFEAIAYVGEVDIEEEGVLLSIAAVDLGGDLGAANFIFVSATSPYSDEDVLFIWQDVPLEEEEDEDEDEDEGFSVLDLLQQLKIKLGSKLKAATLDRLPLQDLVDQFGERMKRAHTPFGIRRLLRGALKRK